MQKQSSVRTAGFARRVMGAVALAWSVGVSAQQAMPVTELSSGIHLIRVEVAATPADRQRGLMFREALGPGAGMLFVFDGPSQQCMWMRNTLIPLAVAFIDDDGRIVNIEEMTPQTDDTHCSSRPVRYALEMNAGWFAKRGLKPGTVIDGIARRR